MTKREIIETNTNGELLCPKCNHPMHWESNWNADEVSDSEEEGLSPDVALVLHSCPACDAMNYVYSKEDKLQGIDADLI